MYFFLLDIVIVFTVSIVFVRELVTRGVLTEAFSSACALVVVVVLVLGVDAATGDHWEFFWYGRDRKVVGNDRNIL